MTEEEIIRVLDRVDELFEENGYALDSTQALCIQAALKEVIS